jgi:hypothetical protein
MFSQDVRERIATNFIEQDSSWQPHHFTLGIGSREPATGGFGWFPRLIGLHNRPQSPVE